MTRLRPPSIDGTSISPPSAAVTIDTEVRKFVDDAYEKALTLLRENLEKLHGVANALLEKTIAKSAVNAGIWIFLAIIDLA